MRNYRNFTSVLTVLLLVGIGAGCENAPQIAGPSDQAPQFAPGTANGGRQSTTSTAVTWRSDFTAADANATLSSGGGTIEIIDAETKDVIVALYVPGGAATGAPIDYSMVLDCTTPGACEILLEATRNGRDASKFRKGVKLYINLNYLAVTPGTRVTIAESHGGSYTPVPTRVEGDFLVGTLNHFSAYVPITD